MNPTNDKIKYKITINAIDQVWKIKINAVLINKNEYLISFVFHPKVLNFNANIGRGTTISKLMMTIRMDRLTGS